MLTSLSTTMERRQVGLYLTALTVGAAAGLISPGVPEAAGLVVEPVLGLLLFTTFLAVPFGRLGAAVRDLRFLCAVTAVNFLCVPPVVWLLTRPLSWTETGIDHVDHVDHVALVVGVHLVLLAPCVDYVIVFTRLAGGAADRLLTATPLLMLTQMLLLPVLLGLFTGPEVVEALDPGPFISAFLWLIVVPMTAAAATQWLAARPSGPGRAGHCISEAGGVLTVPLMMLTLAVVVASQIGAVLAHWRELAAVIPVFVAFSAVMPVIGAMVGRVAGLGVASRRAVVFTAVTRNSLVVLPTALTLPPVFSAAPLVVVTQTLVELVVMVVMVRVVPLLVR